MNQEEHLMTYFAEELGEFATEILELKTGIDEHRYLPTRSLEPIQAEWNDLLGCIEKLKTVGVELNIHVKATDSKKTIVIGANNYFLGEFAKEILDLQKQVFKALRFGIDEQRDLPTSNRERILLKWSDLLNRIETLKKAGIDLCPDAKAIEAKKVKIDKYCEYAKELGTLV